MLINQLHACIQSLSSHCKHGDDDSDDDDDDDDVDGDDDDQSSDEKDYRDLDVLAMRENQNDRDLAVSTITT